jgi:hypothetical protein
MTVPYPKENESHPSSSPHFLGSDKSPSDAQIRMESERCFIITRVFLEPMYAQYWLKGMDVNLHVCRTGV